MNLPKLVFATKNLSSSKLVSKSSLQVENSRDEVFMMVWSGERRGSRSTLCCISRLMIRGVVRSLTSLIMWLQYPNVESSEILIERDDDGSAQSSVLCIISETQSL